jgi:hypothetical protein
MGATYAQDYRYYQGTALSAAEVMSIADKSGGLRTCERVAEGGDQDFLDINGYGYKCVLCSSLFCFCCVPYVIEFIVEGTCYNDFVW